jgi:hypothetical protein
MVAKASAKSKVKKNASKFFDPLKDTFAVGDLEVSKSELKKLAKLPSPVVTYDMTYELYQGSIERFYFWIRDQLKFDMGYHVYKLEDDFMASITSSFWGSIEQRRSTQQEKVSQYLGLIGNMIKSLFQILRSLRIMEERWQYYEDSRKGEKSAEIALKGLWVDLVEGGGKNPSSVYALAAQVGFVTLPDLFFDLTPKTVHDVDKVVNGVDINDKVKEVLKRKLKQFMLWKDATEKEIKTSKTFHLNYLRQHFNTIRLYMSWIKPYLKNIKRLEQKGHRKADILDIADNVVNDVELFATKDQILVMGGSGLTVKHDNIPSYQYKFKTYFPVIRMVFEYRTVPEMAYHQEYQRGAVHMGHTNMSYQGYVMSRYQIDAYIKSKEIEDIDLLTDINASMIALKDDLIKYLNEADELDAEFKLTGKRTEKAKSQSMFESLFGNVGNVFQPFAAMFEFRTLLGKKKLDDKTSTAEEITARKDSIMDKKEKKWAAKLVGGDTFGLYDVFKKAHQMVRW